MLTIVVLFFLQFSYADVNSCSGGKSFEIKSDKHGSGFHFAFVSGKSFKFSACFDQSAKYDLGNINQLDANKLLGHSDCTSFHHKNSARFGWRWNEKTNKIEILAYSYADKVRSIEFMGEMNLFEKANFEILTRENDYLFKFKNQVVVMNRGCEQKNPIRYKLYPYFGGDEVAPHNINVFIWQ